MGSRIIFAAPVSSTSFFFRSALFGSPHFRGSHRSERLFRSRQGRVVEASGMWRVEASSLELLARAGDPRPGPFAIERSVSQPCVEHRFREPGNQSPARWKLSCSAGLIPSSTLVKIFFFSHLGSLKRNASAHLSEVIRRDSPHVKERAAVTLFFQNFRWLSHRRSWGEPGSPQPFLSGYFRRTHARADRARCAVFTSGRAAEHSQDADPVKTKK